MTESVREQCGPDQLWYPGLHLDDEYPTPNDQALVELWQEYSPNAKAVASTEVYGVWTQRHDVKAVASIDLCEVVRDTIVGLDDTTGIERGRRSIYSADTWYSTEARGTDYEWSVVVSAIRALMDNGLIKPIEHIDAMAAVMRNWREQGVYVIANTSTLPGCERGTISHTLGKYLPGCFDALVLPRNHEGTGSMTKARALGIITQEAGIPLAEVPFVHIDDAVRHMDSFTKQYGGNDNMALFVPLHLDNHTGDATHHCPSPFEAFMAANAHFAQKGVVA